MTTTTATATRHRGLGVFLGLVSLSAYGGVAGFLAGAIDMGPEITSRFPFASPVLAGMALLLVVALPTTVAAVAAWRGSPRAGDLTAAAGVLLVGWIVVQVLVIRALSWFQPVYASLGLVLLVLGLRLRPGLTAANGPGASPPRGRRMDRHAQVNTSLLITTSPRPFTVILPDNDRVRREPSVPVRTLRNR